MTLITAPPCLRLVDVALLVGDTWEPGHSLTLGDGRIVAIDEDAGPGAGPGDEWRVAGLGVLPGIVDLHGDAFERCITPRAGVTIDLRLGLEDNDHQLLANGITTFYYAITDGFEPGPRGRDAARGIIDFVHDNRSRLRCDSRLHLRHEVANAEGHDELLGWIDQRRIDLLSINDHLPRPGDEVGFERYKAGVAKRLTMSDEDYEAFVDSLQAAREVGQGQCDELAAAARSAGVPAASHDDATAADLARSRARDVAIAEFPASLDLARDCRAAGQAVVMGAPNLVRGCSHVGWVSVRDAVAAAAVDALVSDYHYPSLFRAPFLTAGLGLLPLAEAWALVSRRPARAAGLDDRGEIAVGQRADLLLLDPAAGSTLDLDAVFVAGRPVVRRDRGGVTV